MSTWVYFVSILIFYTQLVEGDYGEKLSSNSSDESSTSYEESYDVKFDDITTTSDAGVIIEKAILAAEITPEVSFNLVNPPRRRPQHIKRKFVTPNSERFAKSSRSHSSSLSSRGRSRNNSNSSQIPTSNSYGKILQKNDFQTPNFTIRVFSTQNEQKQYPIQNNKENVHITPATVTEVNNMAFGIPGSIASVHNSYDNYHSSPPLWKTYNYPLYTVPSFVSSIEANEILEKERQSQIEATKLYLKQIETAQEYAAKAIAMQKALQGLVQSSESKWKSPSSNEIARNYLPPVNVGYKEDTSSQKTFPRIEAPGVSYIGSKNNDEVQPSYSSGDVTNPIPLDSTVDYAGWRGTYPGPVASPLVLPSGFLADTDAVIRARLAHLKALMTVIESRSPWLWPSAPQPRWR